MSRIVTSDPGQMTKNRSSDPKTALALMAVPHKVLISGTYEELEVYLEDLAQGIAAVGHIPVEPHHTGGALWPLCDKLAVQIQAHYQAYFGIFGERYGIPVSEGNENARSFTEFEFDLTSEAYCSPARPPPIFVMASDNGCSCRFGSIEHHSNERNPTLNIR